MEVCLDIFFGCGTKKVHCQRKNGGFSIYSILFLSGAVFFSSLMRFMETV